MSKSSLERQVRDLAQNRCEYCQIVDGTIQLPHVLDHVIARQHGGKATIENLVLCCGRCNQYKGPYCRLESQYWKIDASLSSSKACLARSLSLVWRAADGNHTNWPIHDISVVYQSAPAGGVEEAIDRRGAIPAS